MSNFAFGTYRITDINPQHIEALKEAIASGIKMIDTSDNYMDGGAERAIALAFRGYEDKIDKVEIVSKFGYIQGSNLQVYKEKSVDEVVEYNEECYHSIAPSFISQQLTKSLQRLQREKLDCYLLHNPEYYILDAINKDVCKADRLDEMFRRIQNAFIALEEEIHSCRINSYGISSNSFSKSSNSDEFLPYEDLTTLAQNAAQIVGNNRHSFTTIELPINILEKDGLKAIKWAKENGIRVLANRPLNAEYNNQIYRLVQYEESKEYYHHLNELLDVCDNKTLKPLFNLLEQLDISKHKFNWIGDYETFLYTQIIPHIKKTLEKIGDKEKDSIFNYIDLFLQEYKKMVLFECSKKTKIQLKEFFSDCTNSLEICALRFLQQIDGIDFILVGMRKPTYVNEVLALQD